MGFDQKGVLVFRVKKNNYGEWDVMESGVKKALASFESKKDASEYAYDLADTRDGSKVEVFDEQGNRLIEIETSH